MREAADDEKVEAALAAFRRLNGNDRRRALALMSLEQQRVPTGELGDLELWSLAVHGALEAALGRSDGRGHGPQVVRRAVGLPANWGPVAEFIEVAGLAALPSAADRLAAFRSVATLVVARAKNTARYADIPLGPKLVGTTQQQVAGIFDNAFPGYARAGLARMVARAPAAR